MKEVHTQQEIEHLKELILLAKAGDVRAFEDIYSKYYTQLFRYIYSRIKNREDALDITQTSLMKIWKSILEWDTNHTSPLAFFFTVAHNTMIDYVRKNSYKEIASDELINKFLRDNESVSDNSNTLSESETLLKLIKELSEEQQQIITLFYTNDMTYKEIAEITGKREDAIRQIHSRAIKKLRESYNNK